jgi:hypothetical protein
VGTSYRHRSASNMSGYPIASFLHGAGAGVFLASIQESMIVH